jgi:hypothetical protein
VDWQKDQLNRETTFSYSGSPDTAAGGTPVTTDPSSNEVADGYQRGGLTFETTGYGTADAATTYYSYHPVTAFAVLRNHGTAFRTTAVGPSSGSHAAAMVNGCVAHSVALDYTAPAPAASM